MISCKITLALFSFLFAVNLNAQTYPCQKQGSNLLSSFIGSWTVAAKDRTSPGNYEENRGESVISWGLKGCSLQEQYTGTFKDHDYGVKYETYLSDSLSIQRTFFDSEHANMMFFQGNITGRSMTNRWYRDHEKKRMQVKNEVKWLDETSFENITHLSTDYGKTWQLTHHWVYTRNN